MRPKLGGVFAVPQQHVTVTGSVAQVAEGAASIETMDTTDAIFIIFDTSCRLMTPTSTQAAPNPGSLVVILRPLMDEGSTKHSYEALFRLRCIHGGSGLNVPAPTLLTYM